MEAAEAEAEEAEEAEAPENFTGLPLGRQRMPCAGPKPCPDIPLTS